MNPEHLRHLLESLKRDEVSTEDVLSRLKNLAFEDVGFAKIDHHRRLRNGYPEVIYGEGKTPEHVAEIFSRLEVLKLEVTGTREEVAGWSGDSRRVFSAEKLVACPGEMDFIDGVEVGEFANKFPAAFTVKLRDAVLEMQRFQKASE